MSEPFCSSFRVYYEDTDAGGIVYHANYLKFCERVRSDFVREVVGFSQRDALKGATQGTGHGFVMTKFNGKFIAPAQLAKRSKTRRASCSMPSAAPWPTSTLPAIPQWRYR